jgi:hypothetical protein
VLLPPHIRTSILETATPAPEVAQLAGIREQLGLDANADVGTAITELRQAQADAAAQAVAIRITELIEAEETGIAAAGVRPVVRELVEARNPQTAAEAETAYGAVVELESVKALLAAHVTETMGPPQRTPVRGQQGAKYFQIPKAEAA